MTTTLKKVLLTLVTCLSVSFVFAQDNRASNEETSKIKAAQITADLKAKLSLEKEQEQKVLELMSIMELKRIGSSDLESKVDQQLVEEMNNILSPSQMQVWLRMQAANKPSGEEPVKVIEEDKD
jgi:hypothetical protein